MRSGLLTSGCLHDQINEPIVKPTNVEKCSHDGILDEASHLRAISGIKSIYSPHSDLKHILLAEMGTSNRNITVTMAPIADRNVVVSARTYQTELMEQAKSENLVICLPTGSGKTYIAVILIKEMSHSIRESLKNGGKRTVFLVKTVQLVTQQSEYILTHTDLTVGKYYGELAVDLWNKEKWEYELENHQVLVFTAQVFLDLIDHANFSLKQINLIIFDECHHASGDDRYAALMNKHYDNCPDPPRVLGLTASISSKKIKPDKLFDNAKELEKTFRARIEIGSSRNEIIKHGTSVQVETILCSSYRDEIMKNNESLTIPFEILNFMYSSIEGYLSANNTTYRKLERDLTDTMLTTDYRGDNIAAYNKQSTDYTAFSQSQSVTIPQLKSYLKSVIEVGHELGLYGLLLFAKILRNRLKSSLVRLSMADSSARGIFDDMFQRLECLVEDILKNLWRLNQHRLEILFSPKVRKLLDRILKQQNENNKRSRCIVFVERVYTATMLSQILSNLASSQEPPWHTPLKIKHVTGIKALFHDKPMTAKHQRETIREFRSQNLNVLIATAVIEEGLDIPDCDLVIRFNKPNNFSSYMQSKGRARAKQNASYVLFMDESNVDEYNRDKNEYSDYEEIEKMIQQGFSLDESDDDLADDLSRIPPYCPSSGVVIDATRAAQLIMQYCGVLGNGQIYPPRFLFRGYSSPYTCILSMPANCPIREDIKCQSNKKKLAKYKCCLEMVKKLHEHGEFNDHCLPNRNRTLLEIEIPIENRIFDLADELFETKSESSFETFSKQIAKFPLQNGPLSANWHLYQIDNQLGFVVPYELMKLPRFNLYENNKTTIIEIVHLKSINYRQYQSELEDFCKYLFEYAFDDMNTNTNLKFDIDNSTFKLLPCLLTEYGDIDRNRMAIICSRRNKSVKRHAELVDGELYYPSHLQDKRFYMNVSDPSLLKRASDPWDQKKSLENVKTYADYFENKYPNIVVRRDEFLATMKGIKKARISYLNEISTKSRKTDKHDSESEPVYYPIELLHYAPLNQVDFELIYKLPSILVRISQLYRIERLRKLFADKIQYYLLCDADQMPLVTFNDYLRTNTNLSLLPLVPLSYPSSSSSYQSLSQPSPDILFQAITRRSASENTDMENLEILGDCFLKLTVSMCLYHRYPAASAGALTVEKAKQISNENLYRIAVKQRLKSYLNVMKINFRGKDANWIPPAYVINETSQLKTDGEPVDLKDYSTQYVKRKAFADMIEAFIGAFLISTDYTITMQFMKWLSIDVIPLDKNNHIMEVPSILCSYSTNDEIRPIVGKFYKEQAFDDIEKIINYNFKNKAYLIAAFTHPSSFANRLTNCYERLEFLGDAVLDFLVTRHIFITDTKITPGRVTDIRQDLSNNGRLAYILVAYRLHTKILHNSPDLFGKIQMYAGDNEVFPKDSSSEIILNTDIDQWADSTAPKALADVFEALVGAIFLDSEKCLKTVWNVIEPLLRQYIDRSITNPNSNPVREFFEKGGKFISESTETDTEKDTIKSIFIVQTANGCLIEGSGTSKKMAKYDACRKAIKLLMRYNVITD
ncbi:unnamed protein product [Rotaria magnacalcarata]|nr:unnamed protein product [Rotaria magnacalcarata]